MHSSKLKVQAIEMARAEGVKRASLQIGAPIKSVKRWLKVGPYRKNAAATASVSPQSQTPAQQ